MEQRGLGELSAEGLDRSSLRYDVSGDLRYRGQSHEINIRLSPETLDQWTRDDLTTWERAFHCEHEARFGHASTDEGVELVTLRLRMSAPASLSYAGVAGERPVSSPTHAAIWFDADGPSSHVRVIDRRGLSEGDEVCGPSILWGPDATLLVPPGVEGTCDEMGTIVLEVG
jgi:N-methylhydantoinase A